MNDKDKEAFEKWRLEYISTHTGYFKMVGTDDLAQVVWGSACEYKQKELGELEAKNVEQKEIIDFCEQKLGKTLKSLIELEKLQAENAKLKRFISALGYDQVVDAVIDSLEKLEYK